MGNEHVALPQSVVEEDHKLDADRRKAAFDLGRLRWHWTDDETNPDRVSYSAYARAVGAGESVIREYAGGWANWRAEQQKLKSGETSRVYARTFTDHVQLARASAIRGLAADAIAQAEDKPQSVGYVLQKRAAEVREVVNTATERAERLGTTVEDEIDRTVQARKRAKNADVSAEKRRRPRGSSAYLAIEGRVASARRQLAAVLTDAEGVDFSDEEVELIRDSMRMLQSLLHLIDSRFAGTPDVDWDSELQRITGGAA